MTPNRSFNELETCFYLNFVIFLPDCSFTPVLFWPLMLVACCSGHFDLSLYVELQTSLNQTGKVYLTLVSSLRLCWVFFPISVKSKYQNNFDESRAWSGEGLSNPNSSCFCDRAGGQQSPALVHFYPHKGDHSLTPFITASAKAGIKPLAFLVTVTHLSWSNRFVLSH